MSDRAAIIARVQRISRALDELSEAAFRGGLKASEYAAVVRLRNEAARCCAKLTERRREEAGTNG